MKTLKNFLKDYFFVQNLFYIKRFSNEIVFKFSKNVEWVSGENSPAENSPSSNSPVENMAATKCTCISEERLTELIKSIFKEEFEIQQKNIVTLISGNFEITMQEIKKVNDEINELKTSIEHTDEVLQERM